MPQLDLDGANSKISADKIEGQSGTTVTVTAGHNLAGSGSGLTALNGSNISTGTVADARISALTASKLTGALPAIDGSSLTGVASPNDVIIQNYTDNYNSNSTSTTEQLAQTITFTGLTASTEYLFLIGISWGATGDNSDGYTNQCICSVRHGSTYIYTSQGASVAEAQQTNMSFNVVPYNYTTGGSETSIDFKFYIWVSNATYTANMFFNKTGHVGSVALENNITAIKV